MARTIRYGIVGTGMMGVEHLRNLAITPAAVVNAVADPVAQSLAAARRLWLEWHHRALRSHFPALRKFTAMLERHLDGFLSHCRYPINSGVLEGCNNKNKVSSASPTAAAMRSTSSFRSGRRFPEFADESNVKLAP
jgi:hypothetical protein